MKIGVELGERRYDVVVREGARKELKTLLDERAPAASSVAIVTSASLESAPWFDFESGRDQFTLQVPEGEAAKTISVLDALLEQLAEQRLSRDDVIVAVGGGAITDLVGFAAATYLRGVSLVQVPTSLVGQVDAAIGGKTGVNLRAGKNLAGAFYQPIGVLCDTGVLSTLPERERLSGLGEVAKCWLLEERGVEDLGSASLSSLIELSIGLKARIVSGDEREGSSRVLLNYGHTLAHALEKLALRRSADELRHGEAVAVGLAFAARLARALGRVSDEVIAYHDEVLDVLGLDGRIPDNFAVDELLEAMTFDKKARHDLSFVLAGPGGYELVSGVEASLVETTLHEFKGEQ
ncbi:MAG TPA: 3-dehydroquinate synthase family protein [Acidimicrobiales bacterium]|nr:3-dehydroquinate synthase family protein [Acidimicrobiales bacterium]